MSEAPQDAVGSQERAAPGSTAGAALRAARQAQGLHIAALAASIKVPQRKLEALEADRLDDLPDVTFARALAKTVCRALKIDPAPVLALMPDLGEQGLEKVHLGLNTTFRDRPGRSMPTDLGILRRPAIWLPLLIMLAAIFVLLMPQHWIVQTRAGAEAASAPAAIGASTPLEPASAVAAWTQAESPASAVASPAPPAASEAEVAQVPVAASAPGAAGTPGASLIELAVSGESWVEVLDANGAALLRRSLAPGEFVGLDGTPPFRIRIGNAAVTRLSYRGESVALAPSTRDNIARLELK